MKYNKVNIKFCIYNKMQDIYIISHIFSFLPFEKRYKLCFTIGNNILIESLRRDINEMEPDNLVKYGAIVGDIMMVRKGIEEFAQRNRIQKQYIIEMETLKENGMTIACCNDQIDVVKYFGEHGTRINGILLRMAVENGSISTLKLIIRNEWYTPNITTNGEIMKLLIMCDRCDILEYMITCNQITVDEVIKYSCKIDNAYVVEQIVSRYYVEEVCKLQEYVVQAALYRSLKVLKIIINKMIISEIWMPIILEHLFNKNSPDCKTHEVLKIIKKYNYIAKMKMK